MSACNFSPSPGTDRNGPLAVLKSYCKMDFTRLPNGATLNSRYCRHRFEVITA